MSCLTFFLINNQLPVQDEYSSNELLGSRNRSRIKPLRECEAITRAFRSRPWQPCMPDGCWSSLAARRATMYSWRRSSCCAETTMHTRSALRLEMWHDLLNRLQNGSPYAIGPLSVPSVGLSATLVYCSQTVGWINMKLGTQVGLGPGHIVLDGDPSPAPQKDTAHDFWPLSVVVEWLDGSICHLARRWVSAQATLC